MSTSLAVALWAAIVVELAIGHWLDASILLGIQAGGGGGERGGWEGAGEGGGGAAPGRQPPAAPRGP